jgi:hypothetical protein
VDTDQQQSIVIGVITCPRYESRTESVRASWLQAIPRAVRVLFVYGRPGEAERIEGDRLYLNCTETYENLPEKIHLFFKYCQEKLDFDYVLKVDDDSYLDPVQFLSFDRKRGDYIGWFSDMGDEANTRIWHYGKCTDKAREVPYEGEYVCEWARGGGYLLSRTAVEIVVEKTASSYLDHLYEDKMVGEALTLDERIRAVHAEYIELGILNPLSPDEMRFFHSLLIGRVRGTDPLVDLERAVTDLNAHRASRTADLTHPDLPNE